MYKLIIKLDREFFTTYNHDTEEFALPHDRVEEYSVYYKENIVAKFWLSNTFKDSIQLFVPMDVDVIEYIFGEMKNRSFQKEHCESI